MSDGFTVPYSSSPPSEPPSTPPGARQAWKNPAGNPFSFSNIGDLSTTPAGPPPSSVGSFTPAGPPPSSYFGSSQPRGQSLFNSRAQFPESSTKDSSARGSKSPGKKGRSPKKSPRKSTNPFAALSAGDSHPPSAQSSPQRRVRRQSQDDDEESQDDEDYEPESTGSDYDSDEDYEDDESAEGGEAVEVRYAAEQEEQDEHSSDGSEQSSLRPSKSDQANILASTSREDTPMRGIKRSFRGQPVAQSTLYKSGTHSAKKDNSTVSAIAKNVASQAGRAELVEPDDLILGTEDNVAKLYPEENSAYDLEDLVEAALNVVPQALIDIWRDCCTRDMPAPSFEQEYTSGIGPANDRPAFHKAVYVADLLLKLFYPPPASGKQAYASSHVGRGKPDSLQPIAAMRQEAYPKVLLNWLEANHNPYRDALASLKSHHPDPTAHMNFWDILFAATLRGNISYVIHVLNNADFSHSRPARGDGQEKEYNSSELENIHKVVKQATAILQTCPGIQNDDWYVDGTDWTIFRRRVDAALQELTAFAEGKGQSHEHAKSNFEASNFGLMSTSSVLSHSTRRAESKVPWSIYQNLKLLYGLVLGGTSELLSVAQDWLEATIALSVWWDGDDSDTHTPHDFSHSRNGKSHLGAPIDRLVDANPGAAYRRRLGASLERATNESIDDAVQINTNNHVEIAIAAIFEGNIEGVLSLLQTWSLPIADAVVEVASQGGWYESAPGVAQNGFDESDLMVLSYGRIETPSNKDGILTTYAEVLFARDNFQRNARGKAKEGWELALEVLGRLDDISLSHERIGDLLSKLTVASDQRADKLINLCQAFGLENDACRIAENYATNVAETTDKYGTALIYYARAHSPKKVKDILELLISYCLVQSQAFPVADSLDPHLKSFLTRPRESLAWLAKIDSQASDLLATQLSGYATLRKFYDTRDDDLLRPMVKKRIAATSLLACIASAADRIQGGLYDEDSTAVIPVEGLLVLLGEAMVFIDRSRRVLTLQQILMLLRTIEDLQTVHSRIQSQCAECLASALKSAHGSAAPPEPRDLMKKSVSDLTASTAFSLVGSSMLGGRGSNIENARKRAWDWRKGLKEDVSAKEIMLMLRVGLARDVSRAWIEGEEM